MDLIADILLIAGASAAAFYCIVLSRRLKRFNDLETGVGGAIAVLSGQVDDMTKTLEVAQNAAHGSNESLEFLTQRAEDVAKRLELLVASMHDLPAAESAPPTAAKARKDTADTAPLPTGFRSTRAAEPKAAA